MSRETAAQNQPMIHLVASMVLFATTKERSPMHHLPNVALRLGVLCLLTWSDFSRDALDAADTQALSTEWKALLDEKLSQWEVFMGVPHPSVSGLPPGTHQAKGNEGAPLGLNNDPKHVYTVQMVTGEPILRITGEIIGCVSTRASFGNYHFRAQLRWGEKKWEPRLHSARNNGILYHCTGPHGAFWNVYKSGIEYQACEGEFGKLYSLAGASAKTAEVFKDAFKKDHRTPGYLEKPTGEWNDLEVYVVNDRSVHLLNGTVVNALSGLAKKEHEKVVPLTAGHIQIQSEAAECYYRRVEIRSITALPDAYQSYWINDPVPKP